MKTIKEITEMLHQAKVPESWIEELTEDGRKGVQTALARWWRQYDRRLKVEQEHAEKKAFDASYAPFKDALVVGVDEAGRGPLAGPVVTAAVILPADTPTLVGLDDSKAISKTERDRLAKEIRQVAIAYSVHVQSVEMIEQLSIYKATKDSMEQAVTSLAVQPHMILADAMNLQVNCPAESIIKGDAKSLSIAAASILAKTTRDAIMTEIHHDFPHYQFEKNAGYGTAEHLQALQEHGPCVHHRTGFEPIKSMLMKR